MDRITYLADESSAYYHRDDMSSAKLMDKAIRRAKARLLRDIEDMVREYAKKGAFASEAEARAFLSKPIDSKTRMKLRERAQGLPEPHRSQMLARLDSAIAYKWTYKNAMLQAGEMASVRMAQGISNTADGAMANAVRNGTARGAYIASVSSGVAISIAMPSKTLAHTIAGQILSFPDALKMSRMLSDSLTDAVLQGLFDGSGIKDIAKSLEPSLYPMYRAKLAPDGALTPDIADKISRQSSYSAIRTVRTTVTQAAAEGEHIANEEAGIDEYKYIATMDERTCDICGDLDGMIFKESDRAYGENSPPMHYNCRCVTVAHIPSITARNTKRTAKDADGNPIFVPSSMTFSEYCRKFLDD